MELVTQVSNLGQELLTPEHAATEEEEEEVGVGLTFFLLQAG